jgi:hypothetical protein
MTCGQAIPLIRVLVAVAGPHATPQHHWLVSPQRQSICTVLLSMLSNRHKDKSSHSIRLVTRQRELAAEILRGCRCGQASSQRDIMSYARSSVRKTSMFSDDASELECIDTSCICYISVLSCCDAFRIGEWLDMR